MKGPMLQRELYTQMMDYTVQGSLWLGTSMLGLELGGGVAAAELATASGASEASSALKGEQLRKHLGQLEKYGKAGFKELENGRIRYYGELKRASKAGEMVGRRVVREWDPATNATRTWMETLDHGGRVRIVRPETGGA